MKTPLWLTWLAGGLGFACACGMLTQALKRQHDEHLKQQTVWQAEKAALENSLANARGRVTTVPGATRIVAVAGKVSPDEILERLKEMKAAQNSPRSTRLLVHQFENLIEAGPAALPAIRAFLARNEEIEYDTGYSRRFRDGKVPADFNVPPSLRLGLFEVVKNIGGPEAGPVLAEVLKSTGRGVEVAYLAGALQQLAPGKYRAAALAAVHELLARPLAADPSSPLDRFDRSFLFGVLMMFSDPSYAAQAQAQLVGADGKVDAVAMNHLRTALGEKSVVLAAQLWQDPRVAADQKEPLARVALAYAGLDPQADTFYQQAINDTNLKPGARRNLIEDLNETGFPDPRHLAPTDLALINRRIAMIAQLSPNAMDAVNAAAFQEACKDLTKMRNSLLGSAP